MQIYKYVVHQVAHAYGKTATFMPKPIKDDNGSGMHTHMSIWQGSKPLFAGNGYAGLSDTCLYFIGGIIKHAKALNAFTNPTTNSYKRLVPGYRSAGAARLFGAQPLGLVPHSVRRGREGQARRVPLPRRDGQPVSRLCGAADGRASTASRTRSIRASRWTRTSTTCRRPSWPRCRPCAVRLREALEALQADHDFLLKGDVFSKDQIEAYLELKWEEVSRWETTPSPVEFDMYYSA